jgi:hypothetical protein
MSTWLTHPEIRRQGERGKEFSQSNRLSLHLHRMAPRLCGAIGSNEPAVRYHLNPPTYPVSVLGNA